MSSADCLRLFVLCFWLLVGDVNCENTQRGYVLRVQAGQAPVGVHNDNGDHKGLSETSVFRRLSAGYRMPSLDRGQSGYVYPAEQQHTIDSKPSQTQSHYPVIPETQNGNVNHFESGSNSASAMQRGKTVVYNRAGHKAFPDGRKIHQASSDSVFSTGTVQFSPLMYRVRTKSTGGFSPVQADNTPVSLYSHSSTVSPDIHSVKSSLKSDATHIRHHIQSIHPQESLLTTGSEVSGYQSAHLFHNSLIHDKTNLLPKVLKPIKDIDSTIKEHSPGSNSGGTQMSYPTWSPRVYSGDVTSEARGYAHVRRLKPGFEKTGPHASTATGKKFSETGFPSVNQNQGSYGHDSKKLGFGPGVPISSERQQNLNQNSRGSQLSSRHPPLPDRQVLVQGKFKPFQRLPADLPAHTHPSDAPHLEAAVTTLPPSLNCTNTTAITGEMSTKSASPMQTEASDAELLPQTSIPEGQSGSSAEVGPTLEENKPLPDSPPKLQLAEDNIEDDKVVTSPSETDQSSTDQPDTTAANVNSSNTS
ncbi:uncharacterized protein LOC122985213 [Thunnus albacares]|uniref:uncharacterized protein LOC122985213 n=1 Tax=Thunnus albacares TaxID=8236 RepID=UPI001CF63F9B|nr:uncharacterized protein LOC122985213 [Thunnus albacares]